jgi:hypothetical protein
MHEFLRQSALLKPAACTKCRLLLQSNGTGCLAYEPLLDAQMQYNAHPCLTQRDPCVVPS